MANGIAIARTKTDFIKLLDLAEPGISHVDLSGAALSAKVKQFNIGALRSKDDLAKLLSEKQAVIAQAKVLQQAAKNAAPATDLSGLTTVQLKDMAKQHGVSLNLTKSEVIDMLDALEPGVDHSGLSGQTLIAAKQKYGIPPLKNKQQLVKALEKTAGQQMAESVKQQALDVAKQQALKKAEQSLKDAAAQIVMPSSPAQYSSFLDSVKVAEGELAKNSGLPAAVVEAHAKEVAVKKLAFQQQVSAMKSGELKDLAKQGKVPHWQWSSKDELVTLFTETDDGKLAAAKAGIEAKHAKWAQKHGGKSSQTTQPVATTPKPVAPEVMQVQREHVVDWLISNHDGHSKQFLRTKSGKVCGIDKGQIFKFLGSDKLSIDYHPNGACGEQEPFYNTVFRAATFMSLHLYTDAALTLPVSEGDMSSPDVAQLDGPSGGSADRQLYLANEHAALDGDIDSAVTAITMAHSAFTNGDVIIVDSEMMTVVSGGGTTQITVARAALGTTAAAHLTGAVVYVAYNYEALTVTPTDTSAPDESTWCRLALTQGGLDAALAGAALPLGNKAHNATISLWRRYTVPPETAVQNKSDIKLRITGTQIRTSV